MPAPARVGVKGATVLEYVQKFKRSNYTGFLPSFYNVNGTLTVSLCKRKLSIIVSCPILVLGAVLGSHARADAKNDVENYQGPAILRATGVRLIGSDLGNY
jgi:hypothetical protein